MEPTHGTNCESLLLDILFYEQSFRRLSPEMEYLLEQHLNKCPGCRHRMISFKSMLRGPEIARNYG
jgi:hypothetical protein